MTYWNIIVGLILALGLVMVAGLSVRDAQRRWRTGGWQALNLPTPRLSVEGSPIKTAVVWMLVVLGVAVNLMAFLGTWIGSTGWPEFGRQAATMVNPLNWRVWTTQLLIFAPAILAVAAIHRKFLQRLSEYWVGAALVVVLVSMQERSLSSVFEWPWFIFGDALHFGFFLVCAIPAAGMLKLDEWIEARANGSSLDSLSRSTYPGKPTNVELLEAETLKNKYAAVLETVSAAVASEALLPAPKDRIKDALILLARHSISLGASRESIEPLKVGYASLADFVSEGDAMRAEALDTLTRDDAGVLDQELVLELAGIPTSSVITEAAERAPVAFRQLVAEFESRVYPPPGFPLPGP